MRIVLGLVLIATALLVGGAPEKADCAVCVSASCYSSSTCSGNCVCIRQGLNIGYCAAID